MSNSSVFSKREMVRDMIPHELYLITDHRLTRGRSLVGVVRDAIEAGVKFIQYREKSLSRREAYRIVSELRELTAGYGVTLIINDDIDMVLAIKADGVHIGQDDMPLSVARRILGKDRIIGISTHNTEEAIEAERDGADYIGVGPIFHTTSKRTGPPVGCDIIRDIKKVVNIPLYAIGGIRERNVEETIEAGADGVAVISGVLEDDDVKERIALLLRLIRGVRSRHLTIDTI